MIKKTQQTNNNNKNNKKNPQNKLYSTESAPTQHKEAEKTAVFRDCSLTYSTYGYYTSF